MYCDDYIFRYAYALLRLIYASNYPYMLTTAAYVCCVFGFRKNQKNKKAQFSLYKRRIALPTISLNDLARTKIKSWTGLAAPNDGGPAIIAQLLCEE